jgi:hypothetical protein
MSINQTNEERELSFENDGIGLFLESRESNVINSGVTERVIEGVNESGQIQTSGGGGGSVEDEEAGNEHSNGRLNVDTTDYILEGGWSFDSNALLHTGTSKSYVGIEKPNGTQLHSINHIFRFEVKAGSVSIDSAAVIKNNQIMGSGAGDYGVGVHTIDPMQVLDIAGGRGTIYLHSSTDGTILDNIYLEAK